MNETRCWACDTLIRKSRLEKHHLVGRGNDKTIDLCVVCHDLIDRFKLNDMNVIVEFMRAAEELNELPRGRCKYIKLFLLKMSKIAYMIEKDKAKSGD